MTQIPDRPVIGVTASTIEADEGCADVVERSGGDPWIIPPNHGLSAEDTLSRVSGLVACSGEEFSPGPQSVEPNEAADTGLDRELTAFEIPLLNVALTRDMPVFCICRGMHALNIALGGKGVQQLLGHSSLDQDGHQASAFHHIFISPGSKLAAVVGSGGFVRVNSRHQSGVREPQKSPLLLASAYSLEDGVIEALESPLHRWVIGVQFRPERRREMPPHFDRLFQSMVERAKEYANAAKS